MDRVDYLHENIDNEFPPPADVVTNRFSYALRYLFNQLGFDASTFEDALYLTDQKGIKIKFGNQICHLIIETDD